MELKRVSPEEAKALLDSDEGFIYLDVRSVEEFHDGHPEGAKNLPVAERGPMGMVPNPHFVEIAEQNFAKDANIITGCLRGARSMRAAQMLLMAGFSSVVDMRGGFDGEPDPASGGLYPGWNRRGLPVSTEPAPENTYAHLKRSQED